MFNISSLSVSNSLCNLVFSELTSSIARFISWNSFWTASTSNWRLSGLASLINASKWSFDTCAGAMLSSNKIESEVMPVSSQNLIRKSTGGLWSPRSIHFRQLIYQLDNSQASSFQVSRQVSSGQGLQCLAYCVSCLRQYDEWGNDLITCVCQYSHKEQGKCISTILICSIQQTYLISISVYYRSILRIVCLIMRRASG